MSSKSATFIVIFIVAIVAFCLASVFAAMTGPISILPNGTDSENTSNDVSNVPVDSGSDDNNYYQDYSESSSSSSDVETTVDSKPTDSPNVETTVDNNYTGL
ncbi:hypothetical protein [Methanobrevibacter sp. YE315]|uniref:hypothetical protein n=1 Tax=Methanobrevibacter sp. YE315 TaxID=1609968 RepID=UPI0008362175|nr:hypothetical protein [Methanobrevibacter sp. YE315]